MRTLAGVCPGFHVFVGDAAVGRQRAGARAIQPPGMGTQAPGLTLHGMRWGHVATRETCSLAIAPFESLPLGLFAQLGLLAGGLADGSVVLWDPAAIVDSNKSASSPTGGKTALLAKMQKHTGAVSAAEGRGEQASVNAKSQVAVSLPPLTVQPTESRDWARMSHAHDAWAGRSMRPMCPMPCASVWLGLISPPKSSCGYPS